METFSALLAICAGNSPVPDEFSARRPETQSFDFSLICVWINGWVNNREAGDLRRYRAHYDVTVMMILQKWENNGTEEIGFVTPHPRSRDYTPVATAQQLAFK